jgi:Restriction endonuclease
MDGLDAELDQLPPHDFEALVASLLDAEFGWRLKRFGPGPDGGVDLVSEEAEGHARTAAVMNDQPSAWAAPAAHSTTPSPRQSMKRTADRSRIVGRLV